jgi:hypothetical protein
MERGGIAKVKQYPLGDDDIRKLLGDVSVHTYPQLGEMSDINQAFDSQGRSILLFPNVSPTMGHWCCMIRRPKGIEFFDPYGEAPEEQKDGLSKTRMEQLDIDRPYLTKLLRASGKPVFYNTHAFQTDKPSIATCGRHCVARLMMKDKSLQDYNDVIEASGLAPDDFVAGLTYDKLKK